MKKIKIFRKSLALVIIMLFIGCSIPVHSIEVNKLDQVDQIIDNNNKDKTITGNPIFPIEGVYFNVKVEITFNDEVWNLPLGVPLIPGIALYVFFTLSSDLQGDPSDVKLELSDGTIYESNRAYVSQLTFFGFFGINSLTPIYDPDGGWVKGRCMIGYFSIWEH